MTTTTVLDNSGALASGHSTPVKVYNFSPLQDSRWPEFVERHPHASIFHLPGWLKALHKTYGYEPVVCTTSAPGTELRNGLVFCRVRSWLTGNRIVSLPFSDHCEPLVDTAENLAALIFDAGESLRREGWKYFELRPLNPESLIADRGTTLEKNESYRIHTLDLRPDLDTLFRSFHKSCVQRKIHRAEREQLTYEEGRSEDLLKKFYQLLLLTRRRHGLPPQPFQWFCNLAGCLGDNVIVRVASKDDQPVASIFTILHKKSLVYKYGCSDAKFHNLGGMLMLHWKAIQQAKQVGALEYDMGRSELGNEGLISFKENWGAKSLPLDYFRISRDAAIHSGPSRRKRLFEAVFSRMPNPLLTAVGEFLYRHMA